MAGTQTPARSISTWASFVNGTTKVPISTANSLSASEPLSSSDVSYISPTSIETLTTSSTGLGDTPTHTTRPEPSSSPVLGSISLASSTTSGANSVLTSETPTRLTSSSLLSSSAQETPITATWPIPASISSQLSSTTTTDTPIPPADPTNAPPSPLDETNRSPSVLMIVAVVISIAIFFLLLSIALRQLVIRKRHHKQSPQQQQPTGLNAEVMMARTPASSRSIASTYHSMHRGGVRIVIERPPDDGRGWTERLWPVPPGHPAATTAAGRGGVHSTRPKGPSVVVAEGDEAGTDPNQWSVVSQDGSNSLPDTGMSAGRGARGYAHDCYNTAVGRAC